MKKIGVINRARRRLGQRSAIRLRWSGWPALHLRAGHPVPGFTRAPVLSKAALAYAKKIEGNRELAIEFLKEAGIIERPGKLARPYR